MRVIDYDYIQFKLDIGFDRWNSLKKYFGMNDETGELKGCSYDYKTGIATFSSKLLPFVYDYLQSIKLDTECLNEVAKYISFKVPIDTTSKEMKGFGKKVCQRTNDNIITLKDEQYDFIKKICKRPYGLVSLYTGMGKGMLISYLASNYTGDGNICIIVPNLSVKAELEERIKVCGFSYTSRVRCIHPAGFLNSSEKDYIDTKKWFEKVDMILMDEGENVSSSLNIIINKYCKNVRMFYSFCGTADRFNNWKLSYDNLKGKFDKLHNETVELMYYFGTVSVYRALPKQLNINLTYLPLPPEQKLPTWMQKQAVPKAVDNVFHSNAFLKYLDYIVENYPNKVIYCPVKTIAQGEYLLDYCNKKDYKAVFWQASSIDSTDNIKNLKIKWYVKPEKIPKKDQGKNYTTLKEQANKHNVQIIFGTSTTYRGIDIKAITDVILMIGASSSIVEQCIGRAARTDEEIRVWLLSNENDRYVDWRNKANELSTPVWDGLQGAKFKHISKLNVKYNTINIKYPIDKQQISNNDKSIVLEDSETMSKKEQFLDKDQKQQNKIFEMLHKSYTPRKSVVEE